jgi:hypothetical protein
MKGRENSRPEKKRMNVKCVRFSKKCEFVLLSGRVVVSAFWVVLEEALPLPTWGVVDEGEDGAAKEGSVSGRQK